MRYLCIALLTSQLAFPAMAFDNENSSTSAALNNNPQTTNSGARSQYDNAPVNNPPAINPPVVNDPVNNPPTYNPPVVNPPPYNPPPNLR